MPKANASVDMDDRLEPANGFSMSRYYPFQTDNSSVRFSTFVVPTLIYGLA